MIHRLACLACGEPAHWVLPGGPLPPYLAHDEPARHRACVATTREVLERANPEAVLFPRLDGALIGWANQQLRPALAVYDYERLVLGVQARDGIELDDAIEDVTYNIEGVWAGEGTPLILHRNGPF